MFLYKFLFLTCCSINFFSCLFSAARPQLYAALTNVTIPRDRKTFLWCHISNKGEPAVTSGQVKWFFRSQNVTAKSSTISNTLSRLTINNAKPSDGGTYTCKVTNTAGLSASANITLTVQGI